MFFLDAHWGAYWPLLDEMSIIFMSCEKPVIVIDDFDAGNGLCFDQYEDRKLDLNYIAESVPDDYKFCLNPWSYRNRGVIFIFPGSAPYGCSFAERDRYSEEKHGLWGKRMKCGPGLQARGMVQEGPGHFESGLERCAASALTPNVSVA